MAHTFVKVHIEATARISFSKISRIFVRQQQRRRRQLPSPHSSAMLAKYVLHDQPPFFRRATKLSRYRARQYQPVHRETAPRCLQFLSSLKFMILGINRAGNTQPQQFPASKHRHIARRCTPVASMLTNKWCKNVLTFRKLHADCSRTSTPLLCMTF